MLKNLTENGFLEKAKSLSIDEVCQIADLPKLQQVCKIFKLDSGKVCFFNVLYLFTFSSQEIN